MRKHIYRRVITPLFHIAKHRYTPLIILGVVLSVGLIAFGVREVHKNGYSNCIKFTLDGSAESAYKCGNHYFGVYDPLSYNIDFAEYYFSKAIAIDPNIPDVWHQYARVAFLRGDYSTALERINMQFTMRGDERMASYYIRGLIAGYAKDYALAEQDFKTFLRWDPNNWAARNDLAWIYFAQGKYKEVVQLLHGFVMTAPPNPWLLTMDAMALYNLGDIETAYTQLLEAREIVSTLTEADWIHAYPGNDPAVAGKGLNAFKQTIENNIVLVENKRNAQ